MALRFDGAFGFPGGFLDVTKTDGVGHGIAMESPERAVNREIAEELGFNLPEEFQVKESDRLCIVEDLETSFILHFYTKEIPIGMYQEIERNVFQAEHFGTETLGVVRVPLNFMMKKHHKGKGLPMFLKNQFAGSSREELIRGLTHHKLVSEEKLNKIL